MHGYKSNTPTWEQVIMILKLPKLYLDSSIYGNHAFKPVLDDLDF